MPARRRREAHDHAEVHRERIDAYNQLLRLGIINNRLYNTHRRVARLRPSS